MPDDLVFDGKDFDDLARQLHVAADRYEREMAPTLLAIGEEVAATAKAIASENSKSEPPTIKVLPAPGAVVIRAGGADDPIAQLDELGNKGSKRSAGTFRHPVFGNSKVWVEQRKHPFLAPALAIRRRAITKRMEEAWERVLRVIESER